MEPPVFASIDSYGARLGDVGYWRPYAEAALASSGLPQQTMQSGFEGTYPTLVGGQLVVKLFGYFPGWRESVAAETAANRAIEGIDVAMALRVLVDCRVTDASRRCCVNVGSVHDPCAVCADVSRLRAVL